MSLTETNMLSLVKRQYMYKWKINSNMFNRLLAAQMLALFLSYINGVSSTSGGTSGGISFSITHISGDMIFFFTLIWSFIAGSSLAVNSYKTDFYFVSTRISSHLSSIAIIISSAILAGTTTGLGSLLLRDIVFFTKSSIETQTGFWIPPLFLLVSVFAASLYALLFLSVGYFFSVLARKNGAGILITVIIGLLFFVTRNSGETTLLIRIIEFFSKESSYAYFTVKTLGVSSLLLLTAVALSNRMEVRT